MASMETKATKDSGNKMALETDAEAADAAPALAAARRTLSKADLTLRVLLFATTLTSVVVTVLSEQTKLVVFFTLKAKFTDSSAIIYFVVALSVACLHSLLSSVVCTFSISRASPSPRLLLGLAFIDTVMAGVVASATGAVASIAYIAHRGNSHVHWSKVCNVFDKFCQHIAGSMIISLVSSIILVLLVMVSTYSLYINSSHK